MIYFAVVMCEEKTCGNFFFNKTDKRSNKFINAIPNILFCKTMINDQILVIS